MSPRTDRLTSAARERGKHLLASGTDRVASGTDRVASGTDRIAGILRGRGKVVAYVGTALAVAGVGLATGAATASAATSGHTATGPPVTRHSGAATAGRATKNPATKSPAAKGQASKSPASKNSATASASTAAAAVAALPSLAELTSVAYKPPVAPVLPHTQQAAASQAPSQPKAITGSATTAHAAISHPATSHAPTSHPVTSHAPTSHPATSHPVTSHAPTSHPAASHAAPATAGRVTKNPTTKNPATEDPASKSPASKSPASKSPAPGSAATATGAVAALPSIAELTSGTHKQPVTPALPHTQQAAASPAPSQPKVITWSQVQQAFYQPPKPTAAQVGQLPADQLTPTGTSGPQSWMPISPAQMSNATAIVQQTLDKKMGIRSAVIAVATAMQESQLLNLHYGDMDSLGLFQQRPSMGWGTAAQITTPSYAAGAFLGALQQYQASDPTWASQPLWASAQAVQKSGFPFAYAKWESQAAGLVKQIAIRLV